MRKRSFVLFAATALLFSACKKDNGGTNNNNNNGGTTTAGPRFTAMKEILATNCAVSGCHAGSSPQGGLNLGDNATIVAQKARIKVRAVDQAGTAAQMPPPPRAALSAGDQQKIVDWINAGGTLGN